ncbi:hypothetical protein NQ176_g9281 [Zarea fungicola]|uniref:Uncharacterized protein n=1 Tax=Zarea fungicola TaxID=93591 RepID=A0ACC1MMQ4_9HYPO|nr:hypothetical protein NQ176_g9281 [Lecanicillium fungicola]
MSELKQLSRSNDKSLAEFLLMMSLRIGWTGGFRKRLDDIGPNFPPSFLDSLDRLAMAMHPECKRMDTTSGKMRHVHDGQGNEYRGDKALSDALNLTQQPSQGGSIQSTALAQCDEVQTPMEFTLYRDDRSESPHPMAQQVRKLPQRDGTRLRQTTGMEFDDVPQLNKIYRGHVISITNYGAFIRLHNVRGQVDGLLHISKMVDGPFVVHPSDLLRHKQEIWVKVKEVEGFKIRLSMAEVDQQTGDDLKLQQQQPQRQSQYSSGPTTDALERAVMYSRMNSDAIVSRDNNTMACRDHEEQLLSPPRSSGTTHTTQSGMSEAAVALEIMAD